MDFAGDLLGRLAMPPSGRNRRVSSNEQPNWSDANFDMTPLEPLQSFELPVLDGPGVITHIWMTSHAGGVNELGSITLRVYWDGCTEPGIEAPLGDFFACGDRPAVVESFPVQVSPTGALTCYWRMPFRKSARIVVTNDNPDRLSGLYWQVDWVQLDDLPVDTPYFYARYRQELPAQMGRDYLIADLEGRGKYVGTVMSVTMAQDGWFGEGDDFFFIDGEEVPSLQGTGSEDYFNDAWGFRPRTSHWFGQPHWQGYMAGDSGVSYRWHVLDPVCFERSLRLRIEHKGNEELSEDGWFFERPDYFSSVAFWYQCGEPKPFGKLPPWPERRVPWERHHLVRAFQHAQVTMGAGPRVETTGFFGGRPSLSWSAAPGADLSIPFDVKEAGRYAVRLVAFMAPGSGRFATLIDGEPTNDVLDLRGAEDEADVLLGARELAAGTHTLAFRCAETDGHPRDLALEMLSLLRLPKPARRVVKTYNEAHFVRLAIGRAAYAYRLAYDAVPPSLEALVDAGLMDRRYLLDENGRPLRCRLAPDGLAVSAAEWEFTFCGLDARR